MVRVIALVIIALVTFICGIGLQNYLDTGSPLYFLKGYRRKTIGIYFGISCIATVLLIMVTNIN
jgi:hypothetical protein